MTTALEIRASKIAEAFLDYELDDLSSYDYKVTEVEDLNNRTYSVEFEVKVHDEVLNNGRFRIALDKKLEKFDQDYFEDGCTIEIELYEDVYEEVQTFEWTIKYFWMALLNRD